MMLLSPSLLKHEKTGYVEGGENTDNVYLVVWGF